MRKLFFWLAWAIITTMYCALLIAAQFIGKVTPRMLAWLHLCEAWAYGEPTTLDAILEENPVPSIWDDTPPIDRSAPRAD